MTKRERMLRACKSVCVMRSLMACAEAVAAQAQETALHFLDGDLSVAIQHEHKLSARLRSTAEECERWIKETGR